MYSKKRAKLKSARMHMCCNLPPPKKSTLEKFKPPSLHVVPNVV